MDVLLPRTLTEALQMKAERPEALPIAGGTDLMVLLNADALRPDAMLDVARLPELGLWRREGDELVVGSGVTYTRVLHELPEMRALAQASRSVGSPQIRNRGTLGGNLGTASPAGDSLPVLAVHDARVVLASVEREREVPWDAFLLGVKRTALEPGELILGARWRVLTGPQTFMKIGTRNAMVISVASLCLALDPATRTARVAMGSVAPTVIRAPEAEAFLADAVERAGAWDDPRAPVAADDAEGFAERVAAAARPIDDLRGSAAYRLHAVRVLARRALARASDELAEEAMAS
ncbi:MAG TPA: FAD binding domain-containing protein [Actinomycetota bacterium]|nr:FAD binding domain-containing protein [Actinomycetota bacterium]